jgi:hypothetical protein
MSWWEEMLKLDLYRTGWIIVVVVVVVVVSEYSRETSLSLSLSFINFL